MACCVEHSKEKIFKAVVKFSLSLLAAFIMPTVFGRNESKLIYYGWDSPNTSTLIKQFDIIRDLPFSGYVFSVDGEDANGAFQAGMLMQPRRFMEEGFDTAMADADKIAEFVDETGVELFAMCWANPGTLDWFDDEGWDNMLNNMRLFLRVAKRAKAKGICFDPESYTGTHPFAFYPEKGHTFAETSVMVRQRGADFMQVIAEEFPEALLLTFGTWEWVHTANALIDDAEDRTPYLSKHTWYGLLVPFCDGWLETIPENMRIINATEAGYMYNTPLDYLYGQRIQRGRGSISESLVDPALQEKFRKHVEGGFGVFYDRFLASAPGGKPDPDDFYLQLYYAMEFTDEYVWLYGERGKYFPLGVTMGRGEKTWDELIPDATKLISMALGKSGKGIHWGANIIKDPGLDKGTEDFVMYQDEWSHGKISYEPADGRSTGAMRMAGVASGGFIKTIDVKPGEKYQVTVYCRREGTAVPQIQARWKNNGMWMNAARKTTCYSESEEWEKCEFIVESHIGADQMSLLFWCIDGKTEADVCWMDDIEIRRFE